jgi:hypothetical protein
MRMLTECDSKKLPHIKMSQCCLAICSESFHQLEHYLFVIFLFGNANIHTEMLMADERLEKLLLSA